MHLLTCLTSLLLAFPLYTVRSSNLTTQNVQEVSGNVSNEESADVTAAVIPQYALEPKTERSFVAATFIYNDPENITLSVPGNAPSTSTPQRTSTQTPSTDVINRQQTVLSSSANSTAETKTDSSNTLSRTLPTSMTEVDARPEINTERHLDARRSTTILSTAFTHKAMPTKEYVSPVPEVPSTAVLTHEEDSFTSRPGKTAKEHHTSPFASPTEAQAESSFKPQITENTSTHTSTNVDGRTADSSSRDKYRVSPPDAPSFPSNSRTDYITPIYYDFTISIGDNTSAVQDIITSFEETVEHNAILTTDLEAVTDKSQNIVVGRKCTRIFQESILWNVTDGGMLALKSCPPGYQGNMYRPCFSNGKWGNVDYSECRLEHLGRMRHMIFHQVQKGMLGNMYVLADEFSTYISSVDMKSPMDRLEAFEILNTFLKLDMTLKMDKSRDIKYIETLLNACNELIKKKTVLFSPGSQKNKLITEKVVEMIFDLTSFAEKALRGLLKTQKKQKAFRATSNVVLYLYRGKLSRQFPLVNFSSEFEREDELSSYFNLEKTLERSAYALIWVKGLNNLLSTETLLVNSDVAVATILSPLNSLNHLMHPPTFDIGLRLKKEIPVGYKLKCGQLWNISHLWNMDDCKKALRKEDIVTCRCHHLGSISLLLEEQPHTTSIDPTPPIGKTITVSCVTSLSLTVLTLVVNFLIKRRDNSLSIFILINLLVCLAAIQITFMTGVNKTERFEVCLSFAVLLHYLFLVSCFWVVSYSIYLLQRLRSCMEYVGKIRDYCAACWLLPTILLIISFVGNPNGYETKQFCWLNVQRGIVWSFVVPVTGLITVNTIVMIVALKTFNEQMSMTHRVEICKTRNSMRAGITLLPFFATNWFFGILAVENADNLILQVIFSFTNSLQGLLTFLFFAVMDNNVQMMFRLKFHEASKPKVSAMRLRKSGSFPILERPLMTLTDDRRRNDCTPLLSHRTTYSEMHDDPCCSNIRV